MTFKGVIFLGAIIAIWPPVIIAGVRRLMRKPKDAAEQRQLGFARLLALLFAVACLVMNYQEIAPDEPRWLMACYFCLIGAPLYIWGCIAVSKFVDRFGGLGE